MNNMFCLETYSKILLVTEQRSHISKGTLCKHVGRKAGRQVTYSKAEKILLWVSDILMIHP